MFPHLELPHFKRKQRPRSEAHHCSPEISDLTGANGAFIVLALKEYVEAHYTVDPCNAGIVNIREIRSLQRQQLSCKEA
jgi:hypothetical protein